MINRATTHKIAGRLLLALSASILGGCGASEGGRDQALVRIGYQKAGTLNLLRLRGGLEPELRKLGVRVQWVGFPAGPQLLEALNAGAIDFGHTGDAPPVLAQAAGVPFVYVGQEPPRSRAEALLVRRDSPIQTVAELKGKRVALNKGSNVHYLLVRLLREAGLGWNDVEVKYMPPADARAAFTGGSIDAWVAWDPYYAEAERNAGARRIADGQGLVTNREFQHASTRLARSQPETVRAILTALNRDAPWARAHPDEVASLFAKELGLEFATMRRVVGRKAYGVEPMDDAVVAEQQAIADAFSELKLIPKPIAVRNIVQRIDFESSTVRGGDPSPPNVAPKLGAEVSTGSLGALSSRP